MDLVVLVFVISISLVLDVIGIVFKATLFEDMGGLSALFGLANLLSDGVLVVQQQFNPNTGLYVAQNASAGSYQLALVTMIVFTVAPFAIVLEGYREKRNRGPWD